jgi:hypothetical protein
LLLISVMIRSVAASLNRDTYLSCFGYNYIGALSGASV